MDKYTRRESVIDALQRGKEQSSRYSSHLTANPSITIFGTVAVIFQDGVYKVAVEELYHPPSAKLYEDEFDIDELHTFQTIAEAEAFLVQRLGINLDGLGPSKGIKHF